MHVQQTILEGVKSALLAASTAAGTNVFLDRVDRLTRAEMPAILVEEGPGGESSAPFGVNGLQERQFQVLLRACVAQRSSYAADARELGGQIEAVLGATSFSVPKPARARLDASRIVLSGDGDQAMAAREQLWTFTYFTRRGAPDTAY